MARGEDYERVCDIRKTSNSVIDEVITNELPRKWYWHPVKREELSWKAEDNDDCKDSSLANSE